MRGIGMCDRGRHPAPSPGIASPATISCPVGARGEAVRPGRGVRNLPVVRPPACGPVNSMQCAPAGARETAMPSTYLSLHYHLIFSTKERRCLIADPWRGRLHAYLGGTVRTLDGVPEAIGGTADHVHMLVGLRALHCLADMLREIKRP